MSIELLGYRPSVYTWAARLTLREKGLAFAWTEVDPFQEVPPAALLALHPFGRVPVLRHDGFALYETAAICAYVDEAFPGPALQPAAAPARARMRQVIGIVDSYGYWPLVRQVFVHGVARPRLGLAGDAGIRRAGLARASQVLDALERLAEDGACLSGTDWSLADFQLGPMIAYFAEDPDGAAELARRPRLAAWFAALSRRTAFRETRPPAEGG
ncbi:glutathione S-transferase family protein [Marinibaculum pumilum]|uniref:Glutathione S-transferase family protein n=1 Tax=Marinibaculum pumilum TaxID=1766165 RepID=A0ABV7L9P4_9PROT